MKRNSIPVADPWILVRGRGGSGSPKGRSVEIFKLTSKKKNPRGGGAGSPDEALHLSMHV